MRNIAAHTKADFPIPPYISINRMGDGLVNIQVRDAVMNVATLSLPEDDWLELARQISEDYANGNP
jgi:hypothetical protein